MIEPTTLARPYARAAFEYARNAGELDSWAAGLATLAAITAEPKVAGMLRDPAMTGDQRAEKLADLAEVPKAMRNLLSAMAENGRLQLLTDVAVLFNELKAALEATVNVEVTSAFDVSDDERNKLEAAIAKRLERTVSITTKTDPALLGGAVIRAGDLVIDGSVRGRLDKLAGALTT
jgi:F-type H+-transporting ATPase subunit delta